MPHKKKSAPKLAKPKSFIQLIVRLKKSRHKKPAWWPDSPAIVLDDEGWSLIRKNEDDHYPIDMNRAVPADQNALHILWKLLDLIEEWKTDHAEVPKSDWEFEFWFYSEGISKGFQTV